MTPIKLVIYGIFLVVPSVYFYNLWQTAGRQEKLANERLEKVRSNQSRFLASEASKQLEKGEPVLARLLAASRLLMLETVID